MISADLSAAVSEALAAAGIPPERCGSAHIDGLTDAERQLYRWVLQHFVEQGRASGEDLRVQACKHDLHSATTADVLAREDLVHLDDEGEVVVAYPFSGSPTSHRVILTRGHEVWAMCAIDALGMAAMLATAIEVRSSDPASREPITGRVDADGTAEWWPADAVVLAGRLSNGPSYAGCCRVLNFLRLARERGMLPRRPRRVRGHPITIADAVAVGGAVFGKALGG